MLKITIPNNNISERKYIVNILFYEFLGLEYEILIKSSDLEVDSWEIELKSSKKLIIEDHFFSKFKNNLAYLKLENIPTEINYQSKINNPYIVEKDIPVIFGTDLLHTEDKKTILCGIDIFASSFFMLTRWEEYVTKSRDNHNRFPALQSLAYRYDFLNRPIVNEYVEMLWNMLKHLGMQHQRKVREYQLFLTHDVDHPLKYTHLTSGLKEIIGDLLKRKSIPLAKQNLIKKLKVLFALENDPFDTFDFLMTTSETLGVKSYFFFMGQGTTKFDNMYNSDDPFIKKLIEKIKKRGHHIGIHPTYNAYNNQMQFRKEKHELEKNLETEILFGREHFLRFEVPATWQLWEDAGMLWDSTLGFADKEGFRCGVCYTYSVFNILTQKKLQLKERPLIVMEGNFTTYQHNIGAKEMTHKIKYLMDKVRKHNGEFVFLWHNSSFNTSQWEEYQSIYKKVLK